jgi:hypothetical protein
MIWASLLLVTLAVARITRLVATDRIMVSFRRWVVNRWGEESEAAYLAHCRWCASIWIGLPAAVGWAMLTLPLHLWWLAGPAWLAMSHVTGLLSRLEEQD